MDPESKKLLEDTFRLAQENNKMLHAMRRSMIVSRVMSFLYWVIIIGSAVLGYFILQPYLTQVLSVYSKASEALRTLK